jgi:hypothetical protein
MNCSTPLRVSRALLVAGCTAKAGDAAKAKSAKVVILFIIPSARLPLETSMLQLVSEVCAHRNGAGMTAPK